MRQLIITLVLSLAALGAKAQEQQRGHEPRFRPDEFRQELVCFVKERAQLSDQEAERFFKLYDEMREQQRKLQKQVNELKWKDHKTLSDKDAQERVVKIMELEEDIATLRKTYYKKMLKTLPATKVHRTILAEDAFHRQMLRKMEPHHGNNHNNKKQQKR